MRKAIRGGRFTVVPFFNKFRTGWESTHGDLLLVNALALAARKDIASSVAVSKVDDSTVRVSTPRGTVQGSDWDNIASVILSATAT